MDAKTSRIGALLLFMSMIVISNCIGVTVAYLIIFLK